MGGDIIDSIALRQIRKLLEENNKLQKEQLNVLKEIRNAQLIK
jgi:hypothetical protein